MILWTIQNELVLNEIERCGSYTSDGTHSFTLDDDGNEDSCIRTAYDWISEKLAKKSTRPTKRHIDPIWAWEKYYNRNDGKPDMRSWRTTTPERVIRLKLDIPQDRLLLSGFDTWHFPLNNWYLATSMKDSERFDKQLEELGILLSQDKKADWNMGRLAVNELLRGKLFPSAVINKFSTIGEQNVDKMWKTIPAVRSYPQSFPQSVNNLGSCEQSFQLFVDKMWKAYFVSKDINKVSALFSIDINDVISPYDKALLLLVSLAVRTIESWDDCLLDTDINNNSSGWKQQYRMLNWLDDNAIFDEKTAWRDFEIQAVFWELHSEDIIGVEHFTTRTTKRY